MSLVDVTPPNAVAFSPAAGAANVSPSANVTVTFDQPIDAASISAASFVLRDANGATIPATVTYNAATRTATLDPTPTLQAGATYTVSVSDVRDAAGNVAAAASWSFTVLTPIVDATLFSASATPAVLSANDSSAVELGVKFRSDVAGFISGVRFFKGLGNDGVHVGKLWTTDGQLLASVTFANETDSGWQQARFTSPVAVAAGTTYIVSYLAPQGHYSYDAAFFQTATNSGVLHAPGSAEAGGNGVYYYGSGGGFPIYSYNAANYWVDPLFTNLGAGGLRAAGSQSRLTLPTRTLRKTTGAEGVRLAIEQDLVMGMYRVARRTLAARDLPGGTLVPLRLDRAPIAFAPAAGAAPIMGAYRKNVDLVGGMRRAAGLVFNVGGGDILTISRWYGRSLFNG